MSGTLGWKAPSVFALCLIGVDFILRLFVLEQHEIKKWTEKPAVIELQQPAEAEIEGDGKVANEDDTPKDKDMRDAKKSDQPQYDSLKAIAYLLFHGKPITGICISFVSAVKCATVPLLILQQTNGFIVSGMYNTALILRVYQRYGLDELQAGYLFFAVAVPAAIMSPFAGILCDRIGPRPLSILCCAAFVPVMLLLIIEQLPLAAFGVILVFSGACSGLINAVRVQTPSHRSPS